MTKPEIRFSFSDLKKDPNRAHLILLSVPLIIVLFTYFGSNDFYLRHLTGGEVLHDLYGYIYHHIGAFLILGIGSIVIGLCLGFSLKELGLGFGKWRLGLLITSISLVVIIPSTLAGARMPDMASEYPVSKDALLHPHLFLVHCLFYLFYYAGWEFFFRGYMLLGLRGWFGQRNANLIQMIPSVIIHTSIVASGKPLIETLGAVPFGLAMGWLTFRTQSIWYAFMIHAFLGLMMDFWQYLLSQGVL